MSKLDSAVNDLHSEMTKVKVDHVYKYLPLQDQIHTYTQTNYEPYLHWNHITQMQDSNKPDQSYNANQTGCRDNFSVQSAHMNYQISESVSNIPLSLKHVIGNFNIQTSPSTLVINVSNRSLKNPNVQSTYMVNGSCTPCTTTNEALTSTIKSQINASKLNETE